MTIKRLGAPPRDRLEIAVILGWAAIIASLLLLTVFTPAPLPVRAPPGDVVVLQPGSAPAAVVTLSADQRTLTVTTHARRDLLVCLRGDCRLVEEWLGK